MQQQAQQHRITPGDTLSNLAHSLVGDYSRWRDLADINGVEDIFEAIEVGRSLEIPTADQLKERAIAFATDLARREGGRILDELTSGLDLSGLRSANVTGTQAWQLVEWVL